MQHKPSPALKPDNRLEQIRERQREYDSLGQDQSGLTLNRHFRGSWASAIRTMIADIAYLLKRREKD